MNLVKCRKAKEEISFQNFKNGTIQLLKEGQHISSTENFPQKVKKRGKNGVWLRLAYQ